MDKAWFEKSSVVYLYVDAMEGRSLIAEIRVAHISQQVGTNLG